MKTSDMSHFNPHEHRFYFTRPSSRNNPGGMDGHHEVLRSVTNPESGRWNTDTEMVALCFSPTMADRIAKALGDDRCTS